MKRQHRHSLLAWVLFLQCTSSQTASLPYSLQVNTGVHVETTSSQTDQSLRNGTQVPWRKQAPEEPTDLMASNTSRATVMPWRAQRSQSWKPEDEVSPMCAYRVIEAGIEGKLCFRSTIPVYMCQKEHCRTVISSGNLVANILINGSVLLQWRQSTFNISNKTNLSRNDYGTNVTSIGMMVNGQHARRRGFELSCWWNGSYTQFECTRVQLAHGCRDYLLIELHENIPYRFCLRSLDRTRTQEQDCVEFTLPPSGMQDIVIAMTTVGGAICVMLVIICLLVAYITENIMSPTTAHTYSYRTHSCH